MAGAREHYDEYWQRPEPPPLADPLAPRRLALLRSLLREAGAVRVLDVGAGSGDVVAALAAEGFDAIGMDVSERATELARSRHPGCTFVAHAVEELPWPFGGDSFDAVVSFDVIEHLLGPRRLLAGARSVLRPGGRLALSTPYHGLVKNLALAALRFDQHFDVEGDHVRFFTDRAVRRLATATGFEVERVSHLGRAWPLWANSLFWLQRS